MQAPGWLTLLLVAATLVGVAVGRWPGLRANRASIALVGAVALVAAGSIPLEAAWRAIDLDTLALLLGMMVLNANLKLAGFFAWSAGLTLCVARGPRALLGLVVGTTGALSALFLNDTVCLMLAPLVLEVARGLRRDPAPYLVGLMLAANAGSVATITGNPQNMWIGVHSGLGYGEFLLALGPLAAASLAIVWVVVMLCFPREFRAGAFERVEPPPVRILRPLLVKSLSVSALLLVLLFARVPFSLAALAAAALLLVTRRVDPERVFAEFDWQLLVFFAALFVVTGAIGEAGLAAGLEHALGGAGSGLGGRVASTALLSNLVSNVPAVLLVGTAGELTRPEWLALAAASTLAGNLTLLGSVSNLIVVEEGRRAGLRLTFLAHLRAGVPVTLLTLLLAWAWLAAAG